MANSAYIKTSNDKHIVVIFKTNEQTYSLQITDLVYQMETETRDSFATYQSANQFFSLQIVVHHCKSSG